MSTYTPRKGESVELTEDTAHLPVSEVINLLIARMRSNPNEFVKWQNIAHKDPARRRGEVWASIVTRIRPFMNRREKQLFNRTLREIHMEDALNTAMATLLN